MQWADLVSRLDAKAAQTFVTAARHIIDAMLIEGERIQAVQTPPARDYAGAALDRSTPAGGWLTRPELRETARKLSEAVAAEKWTEGFLLAMQILMMVKP
jgi:predicted phage gp36 major capsid-like protein